MMEEIPLGTNKEALLKEDMASLGFNYEELNNLDREIFERFRNGTLTAGDIRAHQDLLALSGSPHQLELMNYIVKNFKS